jgi:hypothetical protein
MEESHIILPAFAGSNLHLGVEMIWFALEKISREELKLPAQPNIL